ncbi:orotidine-5'-phosphate decarboxylase [Erysipelothrix urinaevulpis]|uniref:orotidine-5'-phosphate decarboxylase n=1 Tax=Erysipelothrix urinaevulpis TaxID=2683717 RepID=UPI00135C27E3|nr:orotidine-5'-phosphate decarboxylase [Erysipelothrix urinaevulpis]
MTELIIAMDFSSKEEVYSFLEKFKHEQLFLKIGMELYYKEGPKIVEVIKAQGHKIFLDLKLHDIPNTVERTMKNLKSLGVDMVNVHAAGGLEMMKAARQGFGEGIMIAVTQLTSTSEKSMQAEQLINESLQTSVLNYAKLTQEAGLDGVVCSALEASLIHNHVDKQFLCVTPGIRPKTSSVGDQKRVVSPMEACELGSDYIVIGRPITQSHNPYESYKAILKEMENAHE